MMRFLLPLLFLPVLGIAQNSHIHIDQFGYYTQAPKVAIFANPIIGFNSGENFQPGESVEVRNLSNDEIVFTGDLEEWKSGEVDQLSGDQGWHFDFSALTIPGTFYVFDPETGMKSPPFQINDGPYTHILKAATKMFYYNRCGIEKVEPYADSRWTDNKSFDQDRQARYIYDQGNEALEKDLWGGWFDAGDYNKYVTFNFSVIHNLLSAYEHYPEIFGDNWGIPESNNQVPDILDEVKWELDWMKKMANNDGSVIIKMGSKNHSDNSQSPPSVNKDTRYYGPSCSAASATLASNFAHAAIVFNQENNLESYASELVDIASKAFDYATEKLENNNLDTACDDGSIVAGDADLNEALQLEAMVSAAVYLYEISGDEKYHTFIKTYTSNLEPISSNWWGPYKLSLQDALLRYSENANADEQTAATIKSSAQSAVNSNSNNFYGDNDLSLYNDYMPMWSYHWGSSNVKAGYANLNATMARYNIGNDQESLEKKVEAMMHSFHGVNPLGIVYLSNMYEYGASKSINQLYHLWFYDMTMFDHAVDSEVGPAPGYVTGGPNKDFSIHNISPPANQPPAKSYLDFNTGWPDNSWEISEPAIYYQASYIRMLSEVIGKRGIGTVGVEDTEVKKENVQIIPNPATNIISINMNEKSSFNVEIYNLDGKLVFKKTKVHSNERFNLLNLQSGIYFVKMTNENISVSEKLMIR